MNERENNIVLLHSKPFIDTKSSLRAGVFSEADVKRLQKIRQIFEDHKKTIRKRKWRDSEKAMSLANIQQDIDALDHARAILDPK